MLSQAESSRLTRLRVTEKLLSTSFRQRPFATLCRPKRGQIVTRLRCTVHDGCRTQSSFSGAFLRNRSFERQPRPIPTELQNECGAALVQDGTLIAAAEEERFRRISIGRAFPRTPSLLFAF